MEEKEIFKPRTDLTAVSEAHRDILGSIQGIIVGQDQLISHMLIAMICEGHVLLEGLPGLAKTLAAKCLAKSVKTGFKRIQFTPDLMPGDVTGTMMYNMKEGSFSLKKGPIFSNIVLIDEINRAPAKTQSSLFECMEERQVTIDGTSHSLDRPFMVIGTQNPIDQEGTYRLPEAQLDRFLFKLYLDYPALEDEITIIERHQSEQNHILNVDQLQPIIDRDKIQAMQKAVASVVVKKEISRYIAEIVHETRNNPNIYVGASPRASVNLLKTAKAIAAINERDFVIPEDVKALCFPVLNHRIVLSPEKEMEGISKEQVLKSIIEKVPVPN